MIQSHVVLEYSVSFQLDLSDSILQFPLPRISNMLSGQSPPLHQSHHRAPKFLNVENCINTIGGYVLATDVQRVKKPKLPKKRFLKKAIRKTKR